MKKIKLFIALLLVTTFAANAQITKGNWMVGGDASFSYQKSVTKITDESLRLNTSSSNNWYTINFNPNVGYFIYNKLAIGVRFTFSSSKSGESDYNLNNSYYGGGVFMRYYLLKEENRLNVFFEPSINQSSYASLGKSNAYSFKVGNAIFLNSSVGLETSLSFTKSSNEQSDSTGVFFGLGLQIHLEKEK